MIRISYLNKECKNRLVSNTAPVHLFCRLLGSDKKTCVLDKICKPANEKGVSYFIGVLASIFIGVYILLYWFLKITRLYKPLRFLGKFIFIPIKQLIYFFAYCFKFYKGLPR